MLTFLKRFAEKKGILIKNSRKFDAVPKGNPGGKKAVYALYNLARDTILPTLPELSDKRSYHILNLLGLPPAQSLYLMDCLHKSMNVAGAVCEMGVAQGATSQLIAQELITTDKRLYLFDSFKGLPAPTKDDSLINDIGGLGDIRRYEGCMCCPQIMVETKLREIDFPTNRTFIISGFFDENTPEKKNLPDKVCFAFIDFDFYKPTNDALNWLHTVLRAGGYVIIHDYGYFSSGVQKAVDEFKNQYVEFYEWIIPHKIAKGIAILKRVR